MLSPSHTPVDLCSKSGHVHFRGTRRRAALSSKLRRPYMGESPPEELLESPPEELLVGCPLVLKGYLLT